MTPAGGGLSANPSANSSARSGDATQGFGSAAGDFNVNYGSGVSQGGGVPVTVYYAAIAVAAFVAWKKYS